MRSKSGPETLNVVAGYSHDVEGVVESLMAALKDPGLALLQFINSFGVVQVNSWLPPCSTWHHVLGGLAAESSCLAETLW